MDVEMLSPGHSGCFLTWMWRDEREKTRTQTSSLYGALFIHVSHFIFKSVRSILAVYGLCFAYEKFHNTLLLLKSVNGQICFL